ncbi:MFS transporter [Thalassobacillus hwangdonensis]|uniref:MFS transporter n=1 Tax=Thalassobacillus hwangdonensis TaxID=546108 RepID=A0ABW3L1C9_9BACI
MGQVEYQSQAHEENPSFKVNYPVFRLMGGNFVSFFGDQIYLIAIPLIVLALTGSPFIMGVVAALERLPILLQPFLGIVADRFDRRKVLMVCDALRGTVVLILGVTYLTGNLPITYLLIGAFVIGLLSQLYNTAQFAILPRLVRPSDLQLANSINSGIFQTSVFIAPGLGGILIAAYDPGYALVINGISFFAALLAVSSIKLSPPEEKQASTGWMLQIKEGFRFVIQTRPILFTNLSMFLSIFGTTILLTLMVFHLKDTIGLTAGQIGFLLSIGGLGAVGGALASGFFRKRFSYGNILFTAALIGGGSIILFAYVQSFVLLVVANAIGTVCASIQSPCIVTLRQLLTPDRLLGRVQATSRFMTWMLMPVGAFSAGVLAEYIGTSMTIAIGGMVTLIAGFLYLHPSLRVRAMHP